MKGGTNCRQRTVPTTIDLDQMSHNENNNRKLKEEQWGGSDFLVNITYQHTHVKYFSAFKKMTEGK